LEKNGKKFAENWKYFFVKLYFKIIFLFCKNGKNRGAARKKLNKNFKQKNNFAKK